jgi:small-conductance mechanosensitive channel
VRRAWTLDAGSWGALRSALLTRTLAALQQAGIDIPYNQLDVHLHSTPPVAAPDAPGAAPGDAAK